ncbi:DNA (cytosine-5)-methyltransferase 1 [Sinosporangium album]|uniref:DNA (Cytosine-5)-methyltransferase 1 n=1 Tax=Sinosporangium album TaxID=504805 RepID=A0A1G8KTH6_9ACTN|nr:DNA cytosine methyltransferase [Sinosporangium album]SDI46706.1 DNA (cytosine-5)-methyltransferase 1 [Sinosporangium album]
MLTLFDEFSGLGGGTEGASRVPGVVPTFAANHWRLAVESHAANHPTADHYLGDVQQIPDIGQVFPRCDLAWWSPACPAWTDARGVKRVFDRSNQLALWAEDPSEDELAAMRSRALMEEVVLYLRAMAAKGGTPVLAGVVENVIQVRKWDQWDRWLREIHQLGYRTRVLAINSMQVRSRSGDDCPQSRDRAYVALIHESLGRLPDWDKWLRPRAHCSACGEDVDAMQSWKRPGVDMGRYGAQYAWRCPKVTCRHQVVEPQVRPAVEIIDWDTPGTPIGARAGGLKPATLARIEAGIRRYWAPLLTPTGGSWHTDATPTTTPMRTILTRESTGLAVPPLVIPMEGRPGKEARPASDPMRTQTCRAENAVVLPPPFITPLRGGGDQEKARPISDPLHTVTAGGNHHGLVCPPLLVPYYRTGVAAPASMPTGTVTTRDRIGLATAEAPVIDIRDVLFRMLEVKEIQAAMAFPATYRILAPAKRDRVRLLGNAVTPNVSEALMCALVEAVSGEQIERFAA